MPTRQPVRKIWISPVNADDIEEAQEKARIACADDWGHKDLSNIHVLGVAEGNVNILFWEDVTFSYFTEEQLKELEIAFGLKRVESLPVRDGRIDRDSTIWWRSINGPIVVDADEHWDNIKKKRPR